MYYETLGEQPPSKTCPSVCSQKCPTYVHVFCSMYCPLFREFLEIVRCARAGELDKGSGLAQLADLSEIEVEQVGVGGAKTFFEAKVKPK